MLLSRFAPVVLAINSSSNDVHPRFHNARHVLLASGKRWVRRFCAAVMGGPLMLLVLGGCGGTGGGSSPAGPGNAFVYVAGSGGNAIFGFANDSNGVLRPVNGSPFLAPQTPSSMAATPNGKFLYLASGNNNLVNGFSINAASGALASLACSAAASTGTQVINIAIAPSGSFLYALDTGRTITAFSLDASTGCLASLNAASTDVVVGTEKIAVDRSGRFLYETDGPFIAAFSVSPGGTLTRQAGSDFSGVVCCFLGLVADANADLLFTVSDNVPEVQVLAINPASGALSETLNVFQSGSNFSFAFAVNPQGTFGYIADSHGLNAFSIGPGGALASVPGSPFAPASGASLLGIDPSGRFLYAVGGLNTTSSLTAFSINSGALTQHQTVSLAGANPGSIVVVGHPYMRVVREEWQMESGAQLFRE